MTVTPLRPRGLARVPAGAHTASGGRLPKRVSPDTSKSFDPRVTYTGGDLTKLRVEFARAAKAGNTGRLAVLAAQHYEQLMDQARAALDAPGHDTRDGGEP